MIKKILLLVSCLLVIAPHVWATPPSALDLVYDAKKGVLVVNLNHTSNNIRKHYIRKLVVQKNSETPKEYFYTRQPAPALFNYEIPLKAKPQDVIKVTAYCIQGGIKTTDLKILGATKAK
jgi:hypothetical protein